MESKMELCITDYHQVTLDPSTRLSPRCSIVGDVVLGEETSVFDGARIRGDEAPIRIGAQTNIQENTTLHVSFGTPLTVGNHVTIGHNAILHGCTIGNNVLVGMGAIVMDGATIADNCIIGAGSIVTQGKTFESGMLVIGSPARAFRQLSEDEIEAMVTHPADVYMQIGQTLIDDGVFMHPSPEAHIWPDDTCE